MPDQLQHLRSELAEEYLIERELGRGGAATVYLAHDRKHDRAVAIKVLLPALAAGIDAERFLREIKVLASLQHPNILPLFDSGRVAASPYGAWALYYVMPRVDGESLRSRLDRRRKLPLADALRITREVADGLHHAHTHDIVHRDVKPDNILLERETGRALVTDFGIARAMGRVHTPPERLTDPGTTIGTPAYMSPEQASGDRELDGRSDIYSLACVLHEMVSGQPPFCGQTTQAIMAQHLTVEAPALRGAWLDVPAPIERAVARALAKSPARRFATAADFARALALPDDAAGRIRRLLSSISFMSPAALAAAYRRARHRDETDER
ncbi:MAG: serine/threonine-protein kinase [Gemmatimonadaceae bacterium]